LKAVIVDINRKSVVALCKNGEFIKLKNKHYFNVGNEIDVPAAKVINLKTLTRITSIAAMFLLFVGLSFGIYTYNKPYSYIDIDINPSIEITTNVFNRVILIKGLNKDGEKVLETGKYKNKNIEACIKIVLDSAMKNGYLLTEKNNAVLFTVSSHDEEKTVELEKAVSTSAQEDLKEIKVVTEVITEKVSLKSHNEAIKLGISPGKLKLIEKLQKIDPEIKVEDYKDAAVKIIMKEIHEGAKAEDSNKDKSDKSDKQNNPGNNKVIEKEDQKDKKLEDKKQEGKIKNKIKKQGESTTPKKQSEIQKSEGNNKTIKNQNKDKEISDTNKKKEDDQKDLKDQEEQEEKEEQNNSSLENETEKQKVGNSREETKDKPKGKVE
jgi:hypothetical protein